MQTHAEAQHSERRAVEMARLSSPSTPVILLTGWGPRLRAESELPAHVDRVLSKPPRLAELRAALAELSEHHSQARDK